MPVTLVTVVEVNVQLIKAKEEPFNSLMEITVG